VGRVADLSPFKRVVLVVGAIVAGIAIFTGAFTVAQFGLGHQDLQANLTNGLFLSFIVLAVLIVVAPVAVRMFDEDVAQKPRTTHEDWMMRLRTLITVSLTIILLVIVLTWFSVPDRIETQTTTTTTDASGNTTSTIRLELRPFVNVFFNTYAVVIAFYFSASAVQSVAATWKKK